MCYRGGLYQKAITAGTCVNKKSISLQNHVDYWSLIMYNQLLVRRIGMSLCELFNEKIARPMLKSGQKM